MRFESLRMLMLRALFEDLGALFEDLGALFEDHDEFLKSGTHFSSTTPP